MCPTRRHPPMLRHSWSRPVDHLFRSLNSLFPGRKRPRRAQRRPEPVQRSAPPRLEPLENRLAPADSAVGLTGNEPNLAVNPFDSNNVAIAQYNNGAQTMKISLDGGTSFPISQNAALPPGFSIFEGDDSFKFDSQGRLFWCY